MTSYQWFINCALIGYGLVLVRIVEKTRIFRILLIASKKILLNKSRGRTKWDTLALQFGGWVWH
jgi:hypothetical protein